MLRTPPYLDTGFRRERSYATFRVFPGGTVPYRGTVRISRPAGPVRLPDDAERPAGAIAPAGRTVTGGRMWLMGTVSPV